MQTLHHLNNNYYHNRIYTPPKMQEGHEEFKELIYKLAVYVPGVILGLAAKLSRINRGKKLTVKEALFQTAVAFSTAWIVWFLLEYFGYQRLSAPAAVVCGRFGDEIMIFIWKYIRLSIENVLKAIK
jgi:hypothetical protein